MTYETFKQTLKKLIKKNKIRWSRFRVGGDLQKLNKMTPKPYILFAIVIACAVFLTMQIVHGESRLVKNDGLGTKTSK